MTLAAPPNFFLAADGRLRAAWRALLYVPVFLALAFVGDMLVVPLMRQAEWGVNPELRLLASGLITAPSAALAAYVLLLLADRRSFRTLGLWFYEGWGRELGLGLLWGLALISLTVGGLFVLGQVRLFQVEEGGLEAAGGLAWNLLLLLPAAAAEELVFRGYPFQRVVEAWGRLPAVTLLSVVFGWLHVNNPSATPLSTVNTVLMGVLLAVAYLRTRGLWLPIGLHFAWNFSMGFFYSLPVSGIELSRRLFTVVPGERTWLSGGNYGPEGSVLTTAVALAATLWLMCTQRLRVSPALEKELQ